jgi:hypothetical protein
MIRGITVGIVLLLAACGSKPPESLCVAQVPAPAACNTPCSPAATPNGCPGGYHCATEGKCDLFCSQGGSECGDGFSCTADGFCVKTGGGSGGSNEPDASCPAVHFSAQPIIPSIQLLVDRSSSMQENFDGQDPPAAGPYKYPVMLDALVGTQGVVTQLEGSVYFGATLYTTDGMTCPSLQTTARMKNNKAAIDAVLTANPPRPKDPNPGFTPTPLAIDAVVADFMANPPPAGSPPVIVLATDGIPNECNSTNSSATASVTAAANAFSKGIKLYIIAIDIPGAAAHVQAMANAGQGVQPAQPNAMPYSASSPGEMAAAFQAIIRGVVSCDLTLDHEIDPGDGPSGTVTLNGTTLSYGTDWMVDPNGRTLHLLGGACTMLKASANPMVDAEFPCGTIIL